MRNCLWISIVFSLLYSVETTLGPSSRKSSVRTIEKVAPPAARSIETPLLPTKPAPQESVEPTDTNVLQRDLIQEDLTAHSILENHASYCSSCADTREFSYPTLIYITPWNNRGYDLIKMFPQKFDYVSPVWFSVKRTDTEKYLIHGTHDIDVQWIETIKQKRPDIRFVPRVAVEHWSQNDLEALIHSEAEKREFGLTLKNLLLEYDHLFDGYVLELLAQFHRASKTDVHHILVDIAAQIHDIDTNSSRKKELILPVPPIEQYFNQEDLNILSNYLDGFHIMTYDFPTKEPGPVAPIGKYFHQHNIRSIFCPFLFIEWIKETMNRLQLPKSGNPPKLFLGINFYGYRYDRILPPPPQDRPQYHNRHILARDYIDFLREYYKKVMIVFDRRAHEHITILYGKATNQNEKSSPEVVIFYPSLKSIYDRLELANKLEVGVGVWDGGQGFDYFFDLF